MPKAKNEILVAEMGVILHHVPQNRSRADLHHRLRDIFSISYSQTLTAAEKNDFHNGCLLLYEISAVDTECGRFRFTDAPAWQESASQIYRPIHGCTRVVS